MSLLRRTVFPLFFSLCLIFFVVTPWGVRSLPACDELPYVTDGDYFTIGSAQDWNSFRCWVNAGDPIISHATVKLTADVDLSTDPNPVSVGTSPNPFSGILDGQGYEITGLTVSNLAFNGGDYDGYAVVAAGLFGSLSEASISNLVIESPVVTIDVSTDVGSENFNRITMIGVLAGAAEYSDFENVSVQTPQMTITNDGEYIISSINIMKVGALIGYVRSSSFDGIDIEGMDIDLDITSNGEGILFVYAGGLTGNLSNNAEGDLIPNYVQRSNLSGSISFNPESTDGDWVMLGGLAGHARAVVIDQLSVTELSITANSENNNTAVGGLIGSVESDWNEVTFDRVSVDAELSGSQFIGGFVGHAEGSQLVITRSFADIDLFGTYALGGFLGYGNYTLLTVEQSYTLGTIQGNNTLGGFFGGEVLALSLTDSFSRVNIQSLEPDVAVYVGGLGGIVTNPGGYVLNRLYYAGVIQSELLERPSVDPLFGYLEMVSNPDWLEGEMVPMQVGPNPPFDVFFDSDLSPDISDHGTGMSTEEMKTLGTFTEGIGDNSDDWFDFELIWLLYESINDGYPMLDAFVVKVSFEVGDGPAFDDQYLMNGAPIDFGDYHREGYVLAWFYDEAFTEPFDPEAPITEDLVLYAQWTQELPPTGDAMQPTFWILGIGLLGLLISRKKGH